MKFKITIIFFIEPKWNRSEIHRREKTEFPFLRKIDSGNERDISALPKKRSVSRQRLGGTGEEKKEGI